MFTTTPHIQVGRRKVRRVKVRIRFTVTVLTSMECLSPTSSRLKMFQEPEDAWCLTAISVEINPFDLKHGMVFSFQPGCVGAYMLTESCGVVDLS